MMNLEDLKKELLKQFPDEIEDSNRYYHMAIEVANGPDKRLAQGLFDISRDEYTHAKFIHDCMVKYGVCVPDDMKCKWEALCKRAHEVYPDVVRRPYKV